MGKRYKCIVSYDGTNFSGFQRQPNKRTIQGEVEKVLFTMHRSKVLIEGAGRTDAGVHAKGQVFHFDSSLNIPEQKWKKALNAQLPEDIYITEVKAMSPDFHARFDAIEREYRYFVHNDHDQNIFKRCYMYYDRAKFDINSMREACKLLEGTHDFTSFCSTKTAVQGSRVRTLYEVTCEKKEETIQFKIRGNGFLYNMVRIIVGTLLDVGAGRISVNEIEDIIKQKDRTQAGKTVPANGLFLWRVSY